MNQWNWKQQFISDAIDAVIDVVAGGICWILDKLF